MRHRAHCAVMPFPDVAIGNYPGCVSWFTPLPHPEGVIGENPAFDVTHLDRSDGGITLVTAAMLAALG